MNIKNPVVQSVLRHAATAAGAVLAHDLITKFDFTADQAKQLGGALLVVASAAWSIYQKMQVKPSTPPTP